MKTKTLFSSISTMMVLTIFLFLGTVVATAFWMSNQLNIRARADTLTMMSGAIAEMQGFLSRTALDYSHWDTAFQNLEDGDLEAFFVNYASGATDGDAFHILAVTGGRVEGVMSWIWNGPEKPVPDLVSPDVLEAVQQALPAVPMSQWSTINFFAESNGSLYAFAGVRIEPLDPAAEGLTSAQMLSSAAFGYRIGEDFLAEFSNKYHVDGLKVVSEEPTGDPSISLTGSGGNPVAHLTWPSPRPGDAVLKRISGPLSGVLVLFTMVAAAVTAVARRSARELVEQEALAYRAARTDKLTELPNRTALHEELRRRNECSKGELSILFLDINGFKVVNDCLGHLGGDRLIIMVKERLEALALKPSLIARAGGDEFVVLVDGTGSAKRAHDISDQIRDVMLPEFRIEDRGFHISFAIGHAQQTGSAHPSEEIMRRADVAMYFAKKHGMAETVNYDPSLESISEKQRDIENALISALERPEEFTIHYQPIVSATTGKTVKAEALARWTSQKLGKIGPDVFIPVAEETGLIVQLGKILFSQICQDLIERPDLRVCLNISPAQLNDGDFVRDVIETLRIMRIDPDRIEMELTEGLVVTNAEMAALKLDQLHEAGFRTALDDFGTGFSSIGYLKRLPFTTLKIDKSFVDGLPTNKSSVGMVHAMILMGHSLSKSVICEGVETEEQASLLRQFNCDMLQGYLFSRPVPLSDLPEIC
ncbi:bifunctional diguanylate cyclase/phosphodiesterase [Parasedimentitalea psychrophila]|uniref:Bifunctional diguanylate cyclase/phosphodiesterase n=1 Tax=Parasedimentitalea psychrophila TaxID=2997337 RepID=A0A9Y2P1Q3_9RHOB|nr:bifunctional diguanylate cyclase/phosphodiesterase [Parasedimentitalea psychrophila]WIY24317.1 bifunctional diguanylate cyclase/phosphodiesterase [Parasedimentitalea psychrophila]